MSHNWRVTFFLVLASLLLTCCRSYTRSVTRAHEVNPEFLRTVLQEGETYKIKLNNESEYKVKVVSVAQDSLYGSFYFMSGERMRKTESRLSLRDIVEVNEARIDVVKTVLLIAVPVAIGAIIVSRMSFPGISL